jgi:hypothetical protein
MTSEKLSGETISGDFSPLLVSCTRARQKNPLAEAQEEHEAQLCDVIITFFLQRSPAAVPLIKT